MLFPLLQKNPCLFCSCYSSAAAIISLQCPSKLKKLDYNVGIIVFFTKFAFLKSYFVSFSIIHVMKYLLTFLFVLPMMALAQREGTPPSVLSNGNLPISKLKGWTHQEVTGDLNKDGVSDLVVMATPNFPEFIEKREDGYEYNYNQPVLAIFFGGKDGNFQCFKQYENVIPRRTDPYNMIDCDVQVTPKGVLQIGVEYFSSMGSWGTSNSSYKFRYQDGDFFLIGQDSQSYMRNTGEAENVSFNYLTGKKQLVTFNMFDEKVKKKEKWSRLPKKPLRKLGAWMLEDGDEGL